MEGPRGTPETDGLGLVSGEGQPRKAAAVFEGHHSIQCEDWAPLLCEPAFLQVGIVAVVIVPENSTKYKIAVRPHDLILKTRNLKKGEN